MQQVSPQLEIPFRLGYRPALDGLRGLAVSAVILYHLGIPYCGGGFLGVDVFFVLSGFLITVLLVEEKEKTGTIGFRNFYMRRMLRLVPAFLVLLLAVTISILLYAQQETERNQGLRAVLCALFYCMNWVRAFLIQHCRFILLEHTWSLSIEEQFYLAWPVLAFGLLKSNLRKPTILLLVALGTVASTTSRFVMWQGPKSIPRIYNGLDTRADMLLIGCLFGLIAGWNLLPSLLLVFRSKVVVTTAIAVLAALFMFASVNERISYLYLLPLTALCVAVVLVEALHRSFAPLRIVLECPALVWIGRISYGLYLWHFPIIMFPRFLGRSVVYTDPRIAVATIALILLTATISFHLIERPILKLKRKYG